MAARGSRTELLAIVGETASGKSDLAIRVAKQFNGEIIAADSWTVYRGFSIGTSKPSKASQKAVKHHLIDVTDATNGFNAPKFKKLAEVAIKDIQKRGKLPILVGGTGLYVDSVLFDFSFLPGAGLGDREKLNLLGISELITLADAQRTDLSGIDTRNKRRIIRAIEAKGQKPSKKPLKRGSFIVGLKVDREKLKKRISQRTEKMIKNGLESEVRQLAYKYGWEVEPMKGIGYREWQEYFKGRQSLYITKKRINSATMNLAKRQRTWFKRNLSICWFDDPADAFEAIKTVVN